MTVRDDNGTPADPADDFDATFVGGDADADGLLDLTETWTFTASRIATAGPVHQPRHRHRHPAARRRPAGDRHQPRQPLRRRRRASTWSS